MKAAQVQTLFIVTIITGLIWLLAESQTLREETVRLSLRVAPGLEGYAVRVDPEFRWNGEVEVVVEGPAGAIASLRELARTPVTLALGGELPSEIGVQEIDLRGALAQDELFRSAGRTVRSVNPEVIRIEVDELVETTLGVLVDPGAVAPAGTPLAEPATVVVRAPGSVARLLPDRAVARLPGEDAERLEPGATATVPAVPVVLADLPASAWGVEIDPPAVGVTITPRRRTLSVVLDAVPVSVLAPPGALDDWSFTLVGDEARTRVRLTGPVAAVERIRGGERAITAVIRVPSEGLAAGTARVVPEFIDLPPGVTAEPESGAVVLTISERVREVPARDGAGDGGPNGGPSDGGVEPELGVGAGLAVGDGRGAGAAGEPVGRDATAEPE